MAGTMTTVKILGQSRMRGGGHTTAGVASNKKVKVWGTISGAYTTGGEAFLPSDIKLETIDFISLQPTLVNNTTVPTTTTRIKAAYVPSSGLILIQTVSAAGVHAIATNAQNYSINFEAIGDSADPELT